MRDSILKKYRRLRAKGWRSAEALRTACTEFAFARREASEDTREGSQFECVRLRYVPDESADVCDLEGDCFNPRANPGIPVARLERERAAFVERLEREGVWGIVAEYWDEAEQAWVTADSCWGFVGDDLHDNGYDSDLKQIALDARTASVRRWRNMLKAAP